MHIHETFDPGPLAVALLGFFQILLLALYHLPVLRFNVVGVHLGDCLIIPCCCKIKYEFSEKDGTFLKSRLQKQINSLVTKGRVQVVAYQFGARV